MKNIIILFVLFLNGFIYSQNIDSLKLKQFDKEIDSIQYSEADFNKLKKHFTENKEAYDYIVKKAASGDKDTSDLLHLLSISYQEAIEKYGEREIKIGIYSYYKSKHILDKFKKLESDFDAKIDSLKLRKNFFEKEIEKDKKVIDSLKKN
jgi:hypothetical protein